MSNAVYERLTALRENVEKGLLPRLDEVMDELDKAKDGMSVEEKCECYDALYLLHEVLDGAKKKGYKFKDLFDKLVVPEALEADKISLASVGRTFSVSHRMSASLVEHGDKGKEPSMEYLKSIDMGELIKPSVHAGSLASAVKERIESTGAEPDPEYVKTNPYTTTNRTKYTSKD